MAAIVDMRRIAHTAVVVCCGFQFLSVSAFAEGAWVLWSQEAATDPDLVPADKMAWRRVATFDSKPACFTDASVKAEALASTLRSSDSLVKERKIEIQRLGLASDHLAVKSTFTAGLYDGARMWTFYRCLPDTAVPRGPQGK